MLLEYIKRAVARYFVFVSKAIPARGLGILERNAKIGVEVRQPDWKTV